MILGQVHLSKARWTVQKYGQNIVDKKIYLKPVAQEVIKKQLICSPYKNLQSVHLCVPGRRQCCTARGPRRRSLTGPGGWPRRKSPTQSPSLSSPRTLRRRQRLHVARPPQPLYSQYVEQCVDYCVLGISKSQSNIRESAT